MGWIYDLVKDLPSAPALKERIALAEDKYARAVEEKERAEKENEELRRRVVKLEGELADLRAKPPVEPGGDLSEDTQDVLVTLFNGDNREVTVGMVAQIFEWKHGLARYHLELLQERGLAHLIGSDGFGELIWCLTPEGRRYVVEKGLQTD